MLIYFVVYQTTNLVNGKIYIGVHQTHNLDDPYLGSGVALTRAIKKYGKSKFSKQILFVCDSRESMFEKERELVNEEFVKRRDTYNSMAGGCGRGIGFKVSPESVAKGLSTKLAKYGPKLQSEEAIAKTKQRLSVLLKHDNPSKRPEVIEKLRQINKGLNNPMYGVKWSESRMLSKLEHLAKQNACLYEDDDYFARTIKRKKFRDWPQD